MKHAQLRDKGNSLLLNSVETLDLLPFQWWVGRHFCSKSIAETTQWGSRPSPPPPQNLILGLSICGTCVVLLFGENLIYIKQLLGHSSGTSMDHDVAIWVRTTRLETETPFFCPDVVESFHIMYWFLTISANNTFAKIPTSHLNGLQYGSSK